MQSATLTETRQHRLRRRDRPQVRRRPRRLGHRRHARRRCWSRCSSRCRQLNFGARSCTFGRLRPLHTNAVIFAFVGNMMFAGIYYSHAAPAARRAWRRDLLSQHPLLGLAGDHRRRRDHAAARASPRARSTRSSSGRSTSRSRSSGWSFAVNFFWTLAQAQREAPLRRDLVLHRDDRHGGDAPHRQQPRRSRLAALKSYSIFGGVQDALVQWWYGHNAVAFFLTTPFLGIMYYFLPKAAERPVYSLPALDHPLLVAGLHLHLGRPAPPALHGAAGLGCRRSAWCSA